MSETEKAWLAGFVDGEGTISLNKRERVYSHVYNLSSRISLVPKFQISNTDKKILLDIQRTLGFGSVTIVRRKRPNVRTGWIFSSQTRNDILYILELIYPYLKLKKKHAELLILYLKEHIFKAYVTDIEMEIYYDLKELNRKGGEKNEIL